MTQIMGILNVTPDSFSDGGQFTQTERAVDHALQMVEQGADWIDIGGESTRPGAQAVSVGQELERVIPVIEALIRALPNARISIDTSKPEVMQAAVNAGAKMINDVAALTFEGALKTASQLNVDVCLMHMQGDPRTMQQNPDYQDVVSEVKSFLTKRSRYCIESGIASEKILIDPGFGFGKTLQHNLVLLRSLGEFKQTGFRLLVGLSRKSMLQAITGQAVEKRLAGSLALALLSHMGGADIVRVHDVEQTRDVLQVADAVLQAKV